MPALQASLAGTEHELQGSRFPVEKSRQLQRQKLSGCNFSASEHRYEGQPQIHLTLVCVRRETAVEDKGKG